MTATATATTGAQVRDRLVDSLRLDLIGPEGAEAERLPESPSDRYLTGFLVPWSLHGRPNQQEPAWQDEAEEEALGGQEPLLKATDAKPDTGTRRPGRLPNALGLTVMLPREAHSLAVTASWGDYRFEVVDEGAGDESRAEAWQRHPKQRHESLPLKPGDHEIALEEGPTGMRLRWVVRHLSDTRQVVTLFLVNRRLPVPKDLREGDPRGDAAKAFQARLEAHAPEAGFAPRPNHGHEGASDQELAETELRFRNRREWGVGHGVGVRCEGQGPAGGPATVATDWLPEAWVPRVVPAEAHEVGLSAEDLNMAQISNPSLSGPQLQARLMPMVASYRAWVAKQATSPLATLDRESTDDREQALERLVDRMQLAVGRLEAGLALLAGDADVALAFRLANAAMEKAQAQRQGQAGKATWRPFQLAFLLQALPGLAQPHHPDRDVVDLLYFPTGGGKTEAYLGLAAFAMVHRRLKHPGREGGGMAVLMRYTLRLLTLDQVGRALQLVMALELMRQAGEEPRLGDWPFELGIWLGGEVTPNKLGEVNDQDPDSARSRTTEHKKNPKLAPAPLPLTACPWCGTSLEHKPEAYRLWPNEQQPKRLRVHCQGPKCPFGGLNALPLVGVDEELYRRLPAFVIGTVDKFAGLPWLEGAGQLFGWVQAWDADGYLAHGGLGGHSLPQGLPGPNLIIQDELHLISGPLGTMVGLYEAAVEALGERRGPDGLSWRPKIVASTATVRRAGEQIRALYARPDDKGWALFPPLGPDPDDRFFARSLSDRHQARRYVGVAARGVSTKVVMMRTMLALLSAAEHQGQQGPPEATDAYRTLVAYFNSLRELGGALRIVKDEVAQRLVKYGARGRSEGPDGGLAARTLRGDPVELTSRVSTADVALTKQRLSTTWSAEPKSNAVDVALATNMIATGLDVTRLGLMLVHGQPLTHAEYIQASSRVGRDPERRPGLVITVLQVNKARDRSHLEHFTHHHEVFEGMVEATSVTPFAESALDRGLEAVAVAMVRHLLAPLRGSKGARGMVQHRSAAEVVADRLAERARLVQPGDEALAQSVRQRVTHLLDRWFKEAARFEEANAPLQYGTEIKGPGKPKAWLRSPQDEEDPAFGEVGAQVVASRSLRDVEGSSPVRLLRMNSHRLLQEAEDA
jgi:hypothetical protein